MFFFQVTDTSQESPMATEPDSPRMAQPPNKRSKSQLSQPEEHKKPTKVRLHLRFSSVFLSLFGCVCLRAGST